MTASAAEQLGARRYDDGAKGVVEMRTAATASGVYFGAHALMIGASLISMPVLTRLLSKSEYGLVSFVFATATVLVVVGGMGLGEATVRFYGERRREGPEALRAVGATMLGGAIAAGLLVCAAAALVAPRLAHGLPQSYVRCLGLGIFLVFVRIVSSVLSQIYRAQERAYAFAVVLVVSRYATMVLAIALLLFRERTAFQVLAATVVVESAAVTLRWVDLALHGFLSRPRLSRSLIAKAVTYGAPLAVAGAANLFLSYSDRFVIERLLGLDAVAIYSVSYDLAERLTDSLLFPVQLAVVPIVFRLWNDDGPRATAEFASQVLSYLVAALIPVAALYLVFSREVIMLLASAKYEQSAALSPYLLPGVALGSLNFMAVIGLTIEKSTARLALNVTAMALLNLLLNLLLIPRFGLFGAAAATSIAYAALVAANYRQSRAVVRLRIDVLVVAKALLAALAMALLLWSAGPLSSRTIVDLAVRAPAGALSAALCFWLLDANLRRWTWSRIQRRSA